MGVETAILAGATALKVVGSLQKGEAEQNAANYRSAVAWQRAASEMDAADAESSDFMRRNKMQLSSARAARGGTGVTMEGSPMLVDEATVREIALGASRVRHAGVVKSQRLGQEAELEKMKGRAAKDASYLEAGQSLLGGGYKMGQAAGMWGGLPERTRA